MNFKKILILSLFLIAIAGIIAPANAALKADVSCSEKPFNGKTKVVFWVSSEIGNFGENEDVPASYRTKMKAEFKKVDKVVLKINGFKAKTYKKPAKGWISKYKYSGESFFYTTFKTTAKMNKKSYSYKIYDNKGKLIKSGKGKIYTDERI